MSKPNRRGANSCALSAFRQFVLARLVDAQTICAIITIEVPLPHDLAAEVLLRSQSGHGGENLDGQLKVGEGNFLSRAALYLRSGLAKLDDTDYPGAMMEVDM